MGLPRIRSSHPLLFVALLASTSCINENEKASPLHPIQRPETSDFPSDTARAWFGALTAAIDAENLNPPEASRRIGYAGVALYEAVVAGMPDHRSLGDQLNGLGELPEPPDGSIHWPSAANAALAAVLAELFAGASAPTLQSFVDLEADLAGQFAASAPAAEIASGVEHGQEIAAELGDWIGDDGYAELDNCAYTVPVADGLWQPTPPGNVANPLEPCWGDLRPFVLLFGGECAPLPPPAFSRDPASPFALEAQEVYDTFNSLTAEQMDIAQFWADGAGTLTPPGHWISITTQILEDEGEDLDVAAEAYAKVGIGLADAFISCWKVKYVFNLLRPVTYIRDPLGPIQDGSWLPFLTDTPPFPEFTSGHSTQSAAAAELLTDVFGELAFDDDDTHPGQSRSFTSFRAAAEEAAISRLYGGIHFRSGVERGLEQGTCIGRVLLMELEFEK